MTRGIFSATARESLEKARASPPSHPLSPEG